MPDHWADARSMQAEPPRLTPDDAFAAARFRGEGVARDMLVCFAVRQNDTAPNHVRALPIQDFQWLLGSSTEHVLLILDSRKLIRLAFAADLSLAGEVTKARVAGAAACLAVSPDGCSALVVRPVHSAGAACVTFTLMDAADLAIRGAWVTASLAGLGSSPAAVWTGRLVVVTCRDNESLYAVATRVFSFDARLGIAEKFTCSLFDSAAVSPCGLWLAGVSEATGTSRVLLLSTRTGRVVATLAHKHGVSVAWAGSSRLQVVTSVSEDLTGHAPGSFGTVALRFQLLVLC